MITEVPSLNMPDWLFAIMGGDVSPKIDLKNILNDSLYYPASGLNGTPVKYLAGNVYSFVYADYGITEEEFLANLNGTEKGCGFAGYHAVFQKKILREDIVPDGWMPEILPSERADIERVAQQERGCRPFGHWSVWARNDDTKNDFGAEGFSFLFLAGEMSALYQGLYIRHNLSPKILAIIQPGAMGGEWEQVTAEDSFFKKVLLSNKAGLPRYLLYGGIGRGGYDNPCWAEYEGKMITRLPERYAGLWELSGKGK